MQRVDGPLGSTILELHNRFAVLAELSIGLPALVIGLGIPFALSNQFVVAGQLTLVHRAANSTAGFMGVRTVREAAFCRSIGDF